MSTRPRRRFTLIPATDRMAFGFAIDSLRANGLRTALAIAGIVIGVVTVVLITSVLSNARTQVAALFQGLGSDNLLAFHLSQDPYSPPTDKEANRRPLLASYAEVIARNSTNIEDVGVQLIVPTIVNGRPLVASAGLIDNDSCLAEGSLAKTFEVIDAPLSEGRLFTAMEETTGARVAILGASVRASLFPGISALGKQVRLSGIAFTVIGVVAPRPGGVFGENRQDSVISMPIRTVQAIFPDAKNILLYMRMKEGRRVEARQDAETLLRRLRGLAPDSPNDFQLTSPDQIIAIFNQVGDAIGAATVALAGISLFIGAIGVGNVMIISVTERTREIGIRRALGATQGSVRRQFLIEAAVLSAVGGILGVLLALGIGFLVTLALPGYDARPPWNAAIAGVVVSILVGLAAGFVPASRAAALDPIEALRTD
ncbi:MAG: ABC transporter permease [Vicinamibacteria bacterium]